MLQYFRLVAGTFLPRWIDLIPIREEFLQNYGVAMMHLLFFMCSNVFETSREALPISGLFLHLARAVLVILQVSQVGSLGK